MKKLYVIVALVLLTACGVNASSPEAGREVGQFELSGGGTARIRVMEIEGTKCIVVGRYSAVAMSCDWSKK
jgi:hypothetical protein